MKKILFLMAMLPMMLFTACSSDDDENIIDTEIWYIARSSQNGNNTITGTFCFFKNGDYDLATFDYKFQTSPVWESATMKTKSGETVKSFFIDIVKKEEGNYGTYKCEPGIYYMVVLVSNKSSENIWKVQKIKAEEGKVTRIDAIFKNMSASGYTKWDD